VRDPVSADYNQENIMGKTFNSIIINAPTDKVWGIVRDFHGIANWSGAVESCDMVGDAKTDQPGARRKLNGAIEETLQGVDNTTLTQTYSIDAGPGPLAEMKNYVGTAVVRAVTSDNSSYVEWSSTWDRNDGAVTEFCNPIYASFLADLKKAAEG
jgi:hypothetical protein